MRRAATFVAIAVLVASCTRETPQPSETAGPRAPVSASSSVGAPSSASAAPSSTPPSGPSPIVLTNLASGEFQIDVRRPIGVGLAATLERRSEDGGWEPLDNLDLGNGYRLVESCADKEPPSCVSLVPGKPVFPVPWQGFGCSAQCNGTCRANAWEGEGTFHLVVRACDGSTSTTGPAFTLPPAELAGRPFERWKVTTDVTSGSVMRLDLAGKLNPADPQEMSLTGFPIRRGTQSPVDRDTGDALVKALRNPHGFDDDIQKRCLMSHLVGFRLRRALLTTGDARDETLDVAIDFTCQKLFVARPGVASSPPRLHATHFDPSRPAFLALAKKALPADGEITGLK